MKCKTANGVSMLSLWLLLILIAIGCVGCGAKSVEPQAGQWSGGFTIKNSGKSDEHWAIAFQVKKDKKTVSDIQAMYYKGDLTPSTKISVLLGSGERAIGKNSFSFKFSDLQGYSTRTIEGECTFTSTNQAKGTMKVSGSTYDWTAVPTGDGQTVDFFDQLLHGNAQGNSSGNSTAPKSSRVAYYIGILILIGIVVLVRTQKAKKRKIVQGPLATGQTGQNINNPVPYGTGTTQTADSAPPAADITDSAGQVQPRYCASCGMTLNGLEKFCPRCGNRINSDNQQAPSDGQEQPPLAP